MGFASATNQNACAQGWGGYGGTLDGLARLGFANSMAQANSPTAFLTNRSNTLAQAALANRPPAPGASLVNSPNAYWNRIRDPGALQPRYDIYSRSGVDREAAIARRPQNRPASTTAAATPAETTPAAPAETPLVMLARYLLRYNDPTPIWDWPRDMIINGEPESRRREAEPALLKVWQEIRQKGRANVTTVVDARRKLVEYGQAVMRYVRQNRSHHIGDFTLRYLDMLLAALENSAVAPLPPR